MLVDSHCHLDFPELFSRLDDVVQAAVRAGVERFVTISTHVGRFERYRAIAEGDRRIYCTVGTHPHNAGEEPDIPAGRIVELSRHPRCIGMGEAGLDYHYDFAPRDVQQRVFRTHIRAARDSGLPLVIHAREADDDMVDILRDEMDRGAFSALLHCFSSTETLARAGLELGFFFSFSGVITYKKADEVRRLAALVPDDRVLVETDAPYLAPVPFRSKPNEPAYVVHTARVLGETHGLNEEEIAAVTTANFYRLFAKAARLEQEDG
ncbi:MAG: TatD family hydrolase [Methylobacteriaceae bacterium]|jgi:TatD DNase family protein|nr:TatD family hydrolase [Methylobacteriaceae bacterium]